ncbi:hypothetical protein CY34DRAFT_805295 [Suillus luteus UH-Slu-Lm8-n1]|uniref:Uncharacterized protein n=1 Tax=Suillus luteus UH-Slu-Lm8-n1 TaxID=930992 RepID=A0A0C9ZWB6_9AGAM|nr:hypothetical protein CY34DRAFT_805295 [Suillus luteus UH-Slu-Lm8-n1]
MIKDFWEKLSHVSVKGAEHDFRECQPHPRRLEGPWLHGLVDDREKNRLIWLHGVAGAGESAVAFNIAERMKGLLRPTDYDTIEKLQNLYFIDA